MARKHHSKEIDTDVDTDKKRDVDGEGAVSEEVLDGVLDESAEDEDLLDEPLAAPVFDDDEERGGW